MIVFRLTKGYMGFTKGLTCDKVLWIDLLGIKYSKFEELEKKGYFEKVEVYTWGDN